jgi:hypothetical protein
VELFAVLNGSLWGILLAIAAIEVIKLISMLSDSRNFEIYKTIAVLFIALFGPFTMYCENLVQKKSLLDEDWSSNSYAIAFMISVFIYGILRKITVDIEKLKKK